MDALWQEALEELRERVGKQNFETWIKPIRFCEQNGNEIRLDVPNKFFRDWLMDHFIEPIEQVLGSLRQRAVRVSLTINHDLRNNDASAKYDKKPDREWDKPQRL
ncbi:MAG TPA: DnaA N-terminal domain-containing protein, partial [Candidatus Binatia bacterium]|nr:DnaA N-terminal domain-containing protein [Candidatus Binatia bacterium]